MMIKKSICVLALSIVSSLHAVVPLKEYKHDVVNLFKKADQQRDLVQKLLEKEEVDFSQLSLAQITETITKLEAYKERLMKTRDSGATWSDEENKYLLLVQELIRQLTNAHLACEQRAASTSAVKKLAIPIGAAVAVTGGLLLLDMFTDLDIDSSTALLCGLATGVAIGAITYRQELSQGIGPLSTAVKHAWDASSWRLAGQVTAAVVGAATVGGLLWQKKEAIAGSFGWKSSQRSLDQVAQENGLNAH